MFEYMYISMFGETGMNEERKKKKEKKNMHHEFEEMAKKYERISSGMNSELCVRQMPGHEN